MARATIDAARRSAGLSLIEVLFATALIGLVLGSVAMAARRGSAAFRRSAANAALDAHAARALQRIVRELAGARGATLLPTPDPPFGSAALEYQLALGHAGGDVLWSAPARLAAELEPGELDDGLDDDGDGLVDEHVVRMVRDVGLPGEQRVVLARGVRVLLEGELDNGADDNGNGLIDERGLSFDLVGGTLTVRLSVERLGPDGETMTRTLETSVMIRNDG